MKALIRHAELEKLYDAIMARESLEFYGPTGSGKSYLLKQLKERLRGRRVPIHLDFNGIFDLGGLIHKLDSELNHQSQEHQNLAFRLRRFREESPVYLLRDLKAWLEYLLKLRDDLSQVGLDFLFIFENPELWELSDDLNGFLSHCRFLSESPNSQMLLVSNKPWEIFNSVPLKDLSLDEIWEQANAEEEKVYNYCRANLAFIKEWLAVSASAEAKTALFFKSKQAIYQSLKARFTPLQWRLLRAIAKYEKVEQPHAFKFLVEHKLGAASSVERALRNLLDTGFLVKKEEGYLVASPLLHRWMQFLYYKQSLA